jgi:hypothetical protein
MGDLLGQDFAIEAKDSLDRWRAPKKALLVRLYVG